MKLHEETTNKKAIRSFYTLETRFINKHGYKYDYSLVKYKNNNTKIEIICKEHGVFTQTPGSHLNNGCPKCVGLQRKTTNEFILDAIAVHKNKYDYSLVDYKNNRTKIHIICKEHGIFKQTPNDHLTGYGCYECGKLVTSRSNTTEFIEKANIKHNQLYDYSLVDYKNNYTKINIKCNKHGVFEQKPQDHLNGNGCPLCAGERTKYEKYKGKPTILYYIRISEVYWKIGLTQATIEKRFNKELGSNIKIETIFTKMYEDGWEAYLIEQKILKDTNHLMIKKKDSPIKGGWTEVRITDIFDYISLEVH